MNVFELVATLGLDSSEFNSGINDAEGKTNDLGASTIAVGQVMADAFEAVIAKVGEFASSVVEAGAQQETALAKVNTIMDTSVMNTSEMSDAIKDLSDQMGISVADLSDTVYNAISATGDTANAVALTEQASKLATAGFTDTSSALSVLTTAMNAYGLSADQATDISDSLIEVQNLGVTTVAELSSNMGKAIATASAYGVDLSNLESAYVSITKAGINTAEGTTYISSMLNELGDSGSEVAGVLVDQTGKSFDQLMAEGYSLGDVLGVLSDSVDGDSTALMNLWSSAEAGKASSAIVSQGLKEFNSNLETITGTAGATEEAYATMADTFEHKQEVLDTKIENLKANLFEDFEPLLEGLFDFVDATILPALDFMADHFDVLGPIILGVATALGTLAIALNIEKMITGVTTAMNALNLAMSANPIGVVIALVAGLATAFGTLYASSESFRNGINSIFGAVKDTIGSVVGWIGDKVTDAKNWGKDMIDNFIGGIKSMFNKLKDTVSNVAGMVADFLGFSEPEKGPLSRFHTFAPDMMDLFAKGIRDNESVVSDQIADSFDFGTIGTIDAGTASGSSGGTSAVLALLQQYLPQIATQSIVMDTGALVGQIAPTMDEALGKRMTLAERMV